MPSTKLTRQTSNSYPNPLPLSLQTHPPASTSESKTSPDSSHDAQLADWMAKNARAKAIIMSTLVPGSEPWHIAEPLEYAADIWKALEEKYGPKNDDKDGDEHDILHENSEQPSEPRWPDKWSGNLAPADDSLAQEVSDGLQEVAELWTREKEQNLAKSNAAETHWIEEKMERNNNSMRDQRFLWALLNGGKDEELGRTYGTEDDAPNDAG
jgi:hypothetical protein